MFYCPRCKAEVPTQSRFCPRCGYYPAPRSAEQANPLSPAAPPTPGAPIMTEAQPPVTPPGVSSISTAHTRALQPRVKRTPTHTTPPVQPSTPAHLRSLSPTTPERRPGQRPQTTKQRTSQFKHLRYQTPIPDTADPPDQYKGRIADQQTSAHSIPQLQPPAPASTQAASIQALSIPTIDRQPTRRLPAERVTRDHVDQQPTRQLPAPPPNAALNGADDMASFATTSRAAERWRTSWRDRQYMEERPAAHVSRGQSLVPEPLSIMQQSFVRMRAIVVPQRGPRKKATAGLGFWISLVLMICLIGGSGTFVASTYLPENGNAPQAFSPQQVAAQPGLSLLDQQGASVTEGQTLHVHGDNFNAGAPIIFLLDNSAAISGTNGRQIGIFASDQGSFDVTMPVTSQWSVGYHLIVAEDNRSGQRAYLSISVSQANQITTAANARLSAKSLLFQTRSGQGNPSEQFVTLTASSALQWTASGSTDDHESWLSVDPAAVSGSLSAGRSIPVGVNIMAVGLASSATPYTGQVIFSINQTEQLTLPVELYVRDSTDEIVISPDPLIGVTAPGGSTCQNNAAITLVNLGDIAVTWTMTLDTTTAAHIQLLAQGQPAPQGRLSPAGQPGDTQVLTLQCKQVQGGEVFQFRITARGTAQIGTIWVQKAS